MDNEALPTQRVNITRVDTTERLALQRRLTHGFRVLLMCCERDLRVTKASPIANDAPAQHDGGEIELLAGLR